MSGIPDYQSLMLPILMLIRDGKETIADCLPSLISTYALAAVEVEQLLPSGKQTVLTNRAHWARNYLSQAGLVEAISRGRYRITKDGAALLAKSPSHVSKKTLEDYPRFQAFLDRSRPKRIPGVSDQLGAGDPSPVLADTTPESTIDALARSIEDILRNDLIEAIMGLTPARFEQLIVDLLIAMGYGGGDANMGQSIGRSGDGGIDGIINEDALGLDAVYVQAKRYAPDNKVGRPAIQAFVGSLTGESATKGVFVTTSDFSKEARDYVERVQQRIVLINGDRLARLMILHEVGVRARQTYVIRSVDEDYFSDAL